MSDLQPRVTWIPSVSMSSALFISLLLLLAVCITGVIVLRKVYGEHLSLFLHVSCIRIGRTCWQWPTTIYSEMADSCCDKVSIVSIRSTDGKQTEWIEEPTHRIKQMDPTRIYRLEYTVRGSVGKPDLKPWVALYGPWLVKRHFPPYPVDTYTQHPAGMTANDPLQGVSLCEDGKEMMNHEDVLSVLEGMRGPLRHDPSQVPSELDAHHWPKEWVLNELQRWVPSPKSPSDVDLFIHFEINGTHRWASAAQLRGCV